MDDIDITGQQDSSALQQVCIKCGNPEIIKDVPNALCAECRNAAIKFPIPPWVKIFGGGILLLLVFSLINLPQNLAIGTNLEKGIKAEQENKYVTALRYFKQAVNLDSSNTEINAHLLIAAYYNNDMADFFKAGDKLSGKTMEDDELVNKVQVLLDKSDYYFPADSFFEIEKKYGTLDSIPDSVFVHYIQTHDDNLFEQTLYASALFDRKAYDATDSVVHAILNTDDENFGALTLMSSVKRFENQPDSAVYYCDRILQMNNEFIYARCLKARALLKMKKNDEALQLALACKNADSTEPYALATLALAYHYNNKPKERDMIIQHARSANDPAATDIFQYVIDVVNNKESL